MRARFAQRFPSAHAYDKRDTFMTLRPGTDPIEILKQAGASPVVLAKFADQLNQMWPEDRGRALEFLQQQSPEDLASFVERLAQPSPDDQYVPGPDYSVLTEVPRGKVFEFTLEGSRVFLGTSRTIRVYIPAAYTADKPACVYVSLDDLFSLAPRAFDNLIYQREIPVLIGIGLRPGVTDSASPPNNPRLNRSCEFDGLNCHLARFLLEEVFPAVERHSTPDGLPIRLSADPNDRAVGGISTGGIGAFTLAWERPDAFRRVFAAIGTFVGMRGGDRYPVVVRKTEPKPIRVFMQDGANDELTTALGEIGDWWMSNQTMQRALEFAGYQVKHVWGEGTHSGKHAVSVFPDAMRWLWRDWPRPVSAGESQNTFLKQILLPEEPWRVVPGSYQSASALASDLDGSLLFWDDVSGHAFKMSESICPAGVSIKRPYKGMAAGPDGLLYVTDTLTQSVTSYSSDGTASTLATGILGSDLVVTYSGIVYVIDRGADSDIGGRLWLITSSGEKRLLDSGLNGPSGVALSPDGLWLAVAEETTHWGYSYRIQRDGAVDAKQRFYWFHVPDEANDSGVGSWVMDREGRLYAATRMGVQVFDRNGRVRAILPV